MSMKIRTALAAGLVVAALCGAPWRVSAQSPAAASPAAAPQAASPGAQPSAATQPAPPSGAPQPAPPPSGAPQGGVPGVPPSPPPPGNGGEWNLSDLIDGVIKMESANLPLSHEQAEKIRPALQKVLEATRVMTETEDRIKQVLTKEQIAFLEARRQAGELPPDAGLGPPKKPGEDPVVAKVLEILEKRAK